jgi:hypothetical protein
MSLTQQVLAEREAAKKRPRQRKLPELGQVTPLPSFALALAPRPLKDASAEFAASLAKLSEARAAVTEAKQALIDARWADEHEARTAQEGGRKPKAATLPDARAAVAEAERMVPAAEYAAREAQHGYLSTLREHREELAAGAESRLTTVTGEVKALVDSLEDALVRRDALARLLDEVSQPSVGEGRHPILNLRERVALGRRRTDALAELRANS